MRNRTSDVDTGGDGLPHLSSFGDGSGAVGATTVVRAPRLPRGGRWSMLSQHEVLQMSKLLTGMNDHYGGVIVEMTTEPMDAAVLVFLLRTLVSHWKQQLL
ncbi:unnamed protein product [Camellia sinensis]